MRILGTNARKRRMTVLRQIAAPAFDPADVLGTELVDQQEDIHGFMAACEAPTTLRLVFTDERTGDSEDVLVERPYAVIGGAQECDLRLIHPDVSQHHAYLQRVAGRVLCCDLGSRTGTHWGTVIRSRNWLRPGEPFYIGPYSIRLADNEFQDGEEAAPATLSQIIATGEGHPELSLLFRNARSRSGRSKLSRIRHSVTLVGWSHLCNLRLQHHSVGRVHCSLVWTREGLWVVDLRCQGGTQVNGNPVKVARIEPGDELVVGMFHLDVAPIAASNRSAQQLDAEASDADDASNSHVELATEAALAAAENESDVFLDQDPGDAAATLPAARAPQALAAIADVSALSLTGGPAWPALAGATGDMTIAATAEAVARSMMQQFAAMQQQWFDQTQQLLAVMAQTFQAAHTQQLQLIREELERVHQVNRELHELNVRRARAGATAPRTGTRAAAAATPMGLPGPAATETGEHSAENRVTNGDSAVAGAAPSESASTVVPLNGRERRARRRAERERERAATAPTDRNGTAPAPDMHAWLSQRINELEHERTSRLQKILQLFTQPSGT